MKEHISGRAYVLGDSVDTDQIIPAAHLVYSMTEPDERRMYGRYALSAVPDAEAGLPRGGIPFVRDEEYASDYRIVLAGNNFGCGSSREHAPFALQVAGVEAVIASSYARIFYRNAVDGGFVVPFECARRLADIVETGDHLDIDVSAGTVYVARLDSTFLLHPLGEVAAILEAGNVFEYARQSGMIG